MIEDQYTKGVGWGEPLNPGEPEVNDTGTSSIAQYNFPTQENSYSLQPQQELGFSSAYNDNEVADSSLAQQTTADNSQYLNDRTPQQTEQPKQEGDGIDRQALVDTFVEDNLEKLKGNLDAFNKDDKLEDKGGAGGTVDKDGEGGEVAAPTEDEVDKKIQNDYEKQSYREVQQQALKNDEEYQSQQAKIESLKKIFDNNLTNEWADSPIIKKILKAKEDALKEQEQFNKRYLQQAKTNMYHTGGLRYQSSAAAEYLKAQMDGNKEKIDTLVAKYEDKLEQARTKLKENANDELDRLVKESKGIKNDINKALDKEHQWSQDYFNNMLKENKERRDTFKFQIDVTEKNAKMAAAKAFATGKLLTAEELQNDYGLSSVSAGLYMQKYREMKAKDDNLRARTAASNRSNRPTSDGVNGTVDDSDLVNYISQQLLAEGGDYTKSEALAAAGKLIKNKSTRSFYEKELLKLKNKDGGGDIKPKKTNYTTSELNLGKKLYKRSLERKSEQFKNDILKSYEESFDEKLDKIDMVGVDDIELAQADAIMAAKEKSNYSQMNATEKQIFDKQVEAAKQFVKQSHITSKGNGISGFFNNFDSASLEINSGIAEGFETAGEFLAGPSNVNTTINKYLDSTTPDIINSINIDDNTAKIIYDNSGY